MQSARGSAECQLMQLALHYYYQKLIITLLMLLFLRGLTHQLEQDKVLQRLADWLAGPTTTCRPNPALHLLLQVKLNWHTITPIHLRIICDYFYTRTAELSDYDRHGMAHKAKNNYYPALYRKNVSTPGLRLCNSFPWGGEIPSPPFFSPPVLLKYT